MRGVFYSVVTVMLLVPLLILSYAHNQSYLDSTRKYELTQLSTTAASIYENAETRLLENINMTWTEENITFLANQSSILSFVTRVEQDLSEAYENTTFGIDVEMGPLRAGEITFNENRTFFRSVDDDDIIISTPDEGDIGSDCLGGELGELTYGTTVVPYGAEDCTITISNLTTPDIVVEIRFLSIGYESVTISQGNVTFLTPGSPPEIGITVSSGPVSKSGKLR